jgi:sugar (pentulose or hexulose) kinase
MKRKKNIVIALDLGTTSFKCALVNEEGILSGTFISENYMIDRKNGGITFPPEKYFEMAFRLLKRASSNALERNLLVDSIGITSQAQTYIPVNKDGKALSDAVVWLDERAEKESEKIASAITDFPRHSGFSEPLGQMFLSKIIHLKNNEPDVHGSAWKFLLLNEYMIFRLTEETYGDSSNQGMGGFFDISKQKISKIALSLAGIEEKHLSQILPPSSFGISLTNKISKMLGIGKVKVYSCGNDQSCAAAGAGLTGEDDILCNFGTAMVVYSLKEKLPSVLLGNQIAGISSIRNYYFLLDFESECGNIFDTLHRNLYPEDKFGFMMEEALKTDLPERGIKDAVPNMYLDIGRISTLKEKYSRASICRALIEGYADKFENMLIGIIGKSEPGRIFASGGLSLSEDWLQFLEKRCSLKFSRIKSCHPALEGVYKTIKQNEVNYGN